MKSFIKNIGYSVKFGLGLSFSAALSLISFTVILSGLGSLIS